MPTNEQLRAAMTAIQNLKVDAFDLLAFALLLDAHDNAISQHQEEPTEPLMTDAESVNAEIDAVIDDPELAIDLWRQAAKFANEGYTA
jgi:hypothetical protein